MQVLPLAEGQSEEEPAGGLNKSHIIGHQKQSN